MSKNSLIERMKKIGVDPSNTKVVSESEFFNQRDVVPTDLHILNIAFTGDVDGGLIPGTTTIAGESKSFKTALCLYCMSAYLKKYEDGIALIYDSEGGITPDYLRTFGIPTDRVLHIPTEHIEFLKLDMFQKLQDIKRGDKVFIMVDSIGLLPSKKEADDALDDKIVADMTRAKQLRSLFRLITFPIQNKDIPCLIVNHFYEELTSTYKKRIISGGQAAMLAPNNAWIITKEQEKDDKTKEILGWHFKINVEKGRMVREKSLFPFDVMYDGGINKFSGLLDIAIEGQFVVAPTQGWYQRVIVDKDGVIAPDKKWRRAETNTEEFWNPVFEKTGFKEYVKSRYRLDKPMVTTILPAEEGDDE